MSHGHTVSPSMRFDPRSKTIYSPFPASSSILLPYISICNPPSRVQSCLRLSPQSCLRCCKAPSGWQDRGPVRGIKVVSVTSHKSIRYLTHLDHAKGGEKAVVPREWSQFPCSFRLFRDTALIPVEGLANALPQSSTIITGYQIITTEH